MARSDKFSPIKKQIIYSDFLDNFDINPVTGILARNTNEDSIKAGLKRLILTKRGERLYNPIYGTRIYSFAFELDTNDPEGLIEDEIRESIKNNEPRVTVHDVTVNIQEYDCEINIIFSIVNITQIQSLSLLVTRVR